MDGGSLGAVSVIQDITERKETQRALERYAERLGILHAADQIILSAASAEEIVAAVLPLIRELIPCRQASVLTFHREASQIEVLGVDADGEITLRTGQRLPLDAGWPLEELVQGEIVFIDDLSSTSIEPARIEALQAMGLRAFINVPLVAGGELLGVLNLGMKEPRPLTPRQREIVRQMADQLAIGLRQAKLHAEVQRYAHRLEAMVARRTAALRAREAQFRAIFEDSVLGIALLDAGGEIVASNPALQTMLRYTGTELAGTRLADYVHPDDVGVGKDLWASLVAGELHYYQVEQRYIAQDGRESSNQLTISRVDSAAADEPQRVMAMVEDVTERNRSREALLRTERLALAGRLGASLAHEINNPLQSVIGCLGLAEEMLDDGAEVRRYLEIAMEELERAAAIVTQLRDLSRESRAKKKVPTDLNALVKRTLLLTRKSCQNQGVRVEWSPAADLAEVPLVPDRMQQVFLNLVMNAVEAMPRGGRLEVSAYLTEQPEGVRIRVADTGVGIEPERLPRIFEPFHSSRREGLGLGLHISQNIVEEHGGRIEVESRAGEGTTATVWLPR